MAGVREVKRASWGLGGVKGVGGSARISGVWECQRDWGGLRGFEGRSRGV